MGNGKSVQIWKDKWIPRPPTYTMYSPPSILDPNATVNHLIDTDKHCWNAALLERLFSREENMSILSLPISSTGQEDKLIWRGTAKGIFTVRSAYHLEKKREAATQAEGSSRVRHSEVWRSIYMEAKNSKC